MAKTHPPSPPAFVAKPVELAHTSGTGRLQLAHERGISEQVRRDWLKRSDGDGRRARRVDDGGAGFIVPVLACIVDSSEVLSPSSKNEASTSTLAPGRANDGSVLAGERGCP